MAGRTDFFGDVVVDDYINSLRRNTSPNPETEQWEYTDSPYFNRQTEDWTQRPVKERIFSGVMSEPEKVKYYKSMYEGVNGRSLSGYDYNSTASRETQESNSLSEWMTIAGLMGGFATAGISGMGAGSGMLDTALPAEMFGGGGATQGGGGGLLEFFSNPTEYTSGFDLPFGGGAPVTEAGTAYAGQDFFPNIGNQVAGSTGSGALGNFMGGASGTLQGSDLVKAGLQYLINNKQSSQAKEMMDYLASKGDALQQPQRAPYQAMSLEMLQNPQSYFQNNPFATALAAQYRNNVIPTQVAKSGNPGQVIDQAGSQFATALGENYNNLAQILSTYGGFNQGAGYSAAAAGSMFPYMQGADTRKYAGIGDILEKGWPSSNQGGAMNNQSSPFQNVFNVKS